tara:strand:+ start:238 stop:879 length:642 start_codon:yes stop_codon:yes gene_type:complete
VVNTERFLNNGKYSVCMSGNNIEIKGNTMIIDGRHYELISFGNQPPTMYLWGADHVVNHDKTQWDDFNAQKKFIEKYSFPVVLHEFFYDVIYDPKTKLYTKRESGEPATEFQEQLEKSSDLLLERTAVRDLADRLEHKVVGCDSRAHLHPSQVSKEERETEQADVIVGYNGTPEKPHIAIIGAIHCLPSSYLNRLLQQKEIDYTLVMGLVGQH